MNPDEAMAIATVVGVVIAGLFGITGIIVGTSRHLAGSNDSANRSLTSSRTDPTFS